MYDYSLNDDERKIFILKHEKVRIDDEDKIEVYYADGSVDIIDDLDENLDIIEKAKDQQIEDALDYEPVFVKKINRSIIGGITLSTGMFTAGSIVAANLPVNDEVKGIVIAGLGVLYLGSIVHNLRKKGPKKELEKLRFLDENREDLESYSQYTNSLNGLDYRVSDMILAREKPYSSLYVEDYDIEALKTIKNNIERARHFNYHEKKKR